MQLVRTGPKEKFDLSTLKEVDDTVAFKKAKKNQSRTIRATAERQGKTVKCLGIEGGGFLVKLVSIIGKE